MARLIEIGQADGLRHFFFGSTSRVVAALEESIRHRYPSAQIAGRHAPGAISRHETVHRRRLR